MTIEKLMFGIECVAMTTYERTNNYCDVWKECNKVLKRHKKDISTKDYLFICRCIDTIGCLDGFEIFETWQDNYKDYDIMTDNRTWQYLRNEISNKLDSLINDLLIDFQNELNIRDGFINPLTSSLLDDNIENLEDTLTEVLMNQIERDS